MLIKHRLKRYLIALRDIIHLSKGDDKTDVQGTIKTVKKSTQIRGATIWTLCGGSLLASIGLDTDSTVLLISAMLISPLMTPILGIGIFYFTNDLVNLNLALKKVAVAAIVCIVTSLLYFLITPLGEMTNEIAARIKPTLLDALVAFIGGITGIISITRKDQTTVLPGVAVAITLMPPLCVIGYGISQWEISIIFGAGYLFLINIILICFVASFIVHWLDFPVGRKPSKHHKLISGRLKLAGMIILLSPGAYWFAELVVTKENTNSIEAYVNNHVSPITEVIDWRVKETDSVKYVEIFTSGNHLSEDSLALLQQTFDSLQLKKTVLKISQPDVKEVLEKVNQVIDSVKVEKNLADTTDTELLQAVKEVVNNVKEIEKVGLQKGNMVFTVRWNSFLVFNKQKKIDKIRSIIALKVNQPIKIIEV